MEICISESPLVIESQCIEMDVAVEFWNGEQFPCAWFEKCQINFQSESATQSDTNPVQEPVWKSKKKWGFSHFRKVFVNFLRLQGFNEIQNVTNMLEICHISKYCGDVRLFYHDYSNIEPLLDPESKVSFSLFIYLLVTKYQLSYSK